MMNIFKLKEPIALIFGGRGFEHRISCLSAERIASLLFDSGLSFFAVYISKSGDWYRFPESPSLIKSAETADTSALKSAYPVRFGGQSGFLIGSELVKTACAIPALHGDFGEDGIVQGALECAGIPYVGQGVLAGAVAQDKEFTKLIADAAGIPTLPHAVLRGEYTNESARSVLGEAKALFGYPMFIKPAGLGSSGGAMGVYSDAEFYEALKNAYELCRGKVLIEKLISPDLELECAFLGGNNKIITAPASVSVGGKTYDYERKYGSRGASTNARAEVKDEIRDAAIKYSERLIELLSLRDLARIDFFLLGDSLYFNEINTFPGFTEGSLYPEMLRLMGISGKELICRLVSLCVERKL